MDSTDGGTSTGTGTGTGTGTPAPCPFGPEFEPSLRASGPAVESGGILSGVTGGRLLLSSPLFGTALVIGVVESDSFPFCGLVGESFPVFRGVDSPAVVPESRLPPKGPSDPNPE